jgi:hypothetical protein
LYPETKPIKYEGVRNTEGDHGLSRLEAHLHYRNNSGAFVGSNKHFYRSWQSAVPTLYVWWMGDNQKEFQCQLEAAGGRYILAYAVDDVIYPEDPRLSLLRM